MLVNPTLPVIVSFRHRGLKRLYKRRIVFRFEDGHAVDINLVDYH